MAMQKIVGGKTFYAKIEQVAFKKIQDSKPISIGVEIYEVMSENDFYLANSVLVPESTLTQQKELLNPETGLIEIVEDIKVFPAYRSTIKQIKPPFHHFVRTLNYNVFENSPGRELLELAVIDQEGNNPIKAAYVWLKQNDSSFSDWSDL